MPSPATSFAVLARSHRAEPEAFCLYDLIFIYFYHASCPCPRREICVRTLALCNFEVATSYLFPSMVRATGKPAAVESIAPGQNTPANSRQISLGFPYAVGPSGKLPT